MGLKKYLRTAELILNRYRRSIESLDTYITVSRVGKARLAKELGLPYKTFYRKLKGRKFTDTQLDKIYLLIEEAKALREAKREK